MRTPKVYVRDSGLVHALLGIRGHEELLGHPVVGASWEGFMIETVVEAVADSDARSWFYRSSAGAEIDLVLEFADGDRWAIEIKRSLAPKPSKGFFSGCEEIQATRRYVLYPGDDQYPIGSSVEVISLQALITAILVRQIPLNPR